MAEPRSNPWPIIAAALALLVLVAGWFAWQGRAVPGDVVRNAANAVPDLRPRLPDGPRLPKVPLPTPK